MQNEFTSALAVGLATLVDFVPKLLLFLVILIVGLIVAKLLSKALAKLLEKVGFDRVRSGDFMVEVPQFISPNFSLERREGIRGLLENVIDFLSPL